MKCHITCFLIRQLENAHALPLSSLNSEHVRQNHEENVWYHRYQWYWYRSLLIRGPKERNKWTNGCSYYYISSMCIFVHAEALSLQNVHEACSLVHNIMRLEKFNILFFSMRRPSLAFICFWAFSTAIKSSKNLAVSTHLKSIFFFCFVFLS